jgi:hypothetical protein
MYIEQAPGHMTSRRSLILGGLALSGLVAAGCSRAADTVAETGNLSTSEASTGGQKVAMTVYRDPSCGCCEAWARIAGETGYKVTLLDDTNMPAVKQRLGVPAQLASCHTVQVGGYVVEGHVPLDQVDRLLRERPAGVKGIAVPGMPVGSPGMEVPDGSVEPFQVIAFDNAGGTSVYKG